MAGGEDFREIGAGIGKAVRDDDGAAGLEVGGIGFVEGGEGDGEVGVVKGEVAEALEPLGPGGKPVAQADGVPMENDVVKEGAAEEEDGAVAGEGVFDGRGGDVIECDGAMAETEPEGAGAVGEKAEDLAGAEAADVGAVGGELRVDVEAFDAVFGVGEAAQHQVDHVALAVMGRGRVGEHDNFHRRAKDGERGGGSEKNFARAAFAWRGRGASCHVLGMPKTEGAAERSLILTPASYVETLDWGRVFERGQPVEIELGSGDGSFLAQYAKLHPERNFLGVERLLGRLRKLNKKGLRAELRNLALLRLEAAYSMEFLVPKESIEALHVYFPDPWPKRKHRKNRLINERFTEIARAGLKKGGIVYLRTDDLDYFEQMTRVFDGNPAFRKVETPEELAGVVTDFERNFHLRGVGTNRAAYQRAE